MDSTEQTTQIEATDPIESSNVDEQPEVTVSEESAQQQDQTTSQPLEEKISKEFAEVDTAGTQTEIVEVKNEDQADSSLSNSENTEAKLEESTETETQAQVQEQDQDQPQPQPQQPQPDQTTEQTQAPQQPTENANNTDGTGPLKSNLKTWFRKQYLGGYRHKENGVEFFHATTQTTTAQELHAQRPITRYHRDTQTIFTKNRKAQTTKEITTQVTTKECFVSSEHDYELTPRPYITSEQHHEMIVGKVVMIQCWVRRIFAMRLLRKLRSEKNARDDMIALGEKRRKELNEKRRAKETESRLHPRTRKDFEMLYHGLEVWRLQETDKINRAGYTEPARLAALANLLDQETALIQKIDRLKVQADEENHDRFVIGLLDRMASSKKWPVKTGGVCYVDTPSTIRARELRDLYHALNVPLVSIDERLQILLHVKFTVKEFDCNLTRDIVQLIDREGDLLSRGRDLKTLEGLRKRIGNLFLQFIRTPEFNPEAATYQKFPEAGQPWKREQSVYYCRSCTKYLPSTSFYLSTSMRHLGKCKACMMKENIATARKDDSIYSILLGVCRLQEEAKRGKSNTETVNNAVDLMQESDIEYLVDTVWNRSSAISGARNLDELVLTRWDPRYELSPWNCILLTKKEAIVHDAQDDPVSLYNPDFVQRISQKLLLARQHFGQLPWLAKYIKTHYKEDKKGKLVPVNMQQAVQV